MARAVAKDRITKIGLTPHLNRLTKHGDNLRLFEQRMAENRLWANRIPVAV
jgi:hypothetical protein